MSSAPIVMLLYFIDRLVEKAAQKLAKLKSSGKPQEIAWNETSVELVQAAKVTMGILQYCKLLIIAHCPYALL